MAVLSHGSASHNTEFVMLFWVMLVFAALAGFLLTIRRHLAFAAGLVLLAEICGLLAELAQLDALAGMPWGFLSAHRAELALYFAYGVAIGAGLSVLCKFLRRAEWRCSHVICVS